MKREQLAKPKRSKKVEEVSDININISEASIIASELDTILDEIDEVLEQNAEEFVNSYIQKGGQ